MAKVNTTEKDAARQENIEKTVSKTEQFYEKYKNLIWGVLVAVVVIFLAALGYSKFIYQPKCAEAMEQAFPAENNFQNGEYELALNGDGNVLGFAQIAAQYGAKAGMSTYLYAGICELQLGNFESAISYLKKYKGDDPILAGRAEACKGDAYVGLEDYASAIQCFKAAADKNGDNLLSATYYHKAGLAYEALGRKAEALECYKLIKDRFSASVEAYDIDKFIARVAE